MILTTTSTIPNKKLIEYKGLVTAETIYGAHIGRDLLATIRDFFGGRSNSYEQVLRDVKKSATIELSKKAEQLGANAVVGIKYDFGVVGHGNSMMMVNVTGTAVTIK